MEGQARSARPPSCRLPRAPHSSTAQPLLHSVALSNFHDPARETTTAVPPSVGTLPQLHNCHFSPTYIHCIISYHTYTFTASRTVLPRPPVAPAADVPACADSYTPYSPQHLVSTVVFNSAFPFFCILFCRFIFCSRRRIRLLSPLGS